ncbi:MAG: hypothetical protein ABIS06_15770, partial [Vicinamibacterales bacterium]
MDIDEVPGSLSGWLGPDATNGLLQLLDRSHQEAREDVITACTERFERRLVEETSGLRVQITRFEATLRQEMTSLGASLRHEIADQGASLRAEIASGRVEFIKWSFLFWIGQVLAMIGILGIMVRAIR